MRVVGVLRAPGGSFGLFGDSGVHPNGSNCWFGSLAVVWLRNGANIWLFGTWYLCLRDERGTLFKCGPYTDFRQTSQKPA